MNSFQPFSFQREVSLPRMIGLWLFLGPLSFSLREFRARLLQGANTCEVPSTGLGPPSKWPSSRWRNLSSPSPSVFESRFQAHVQM